MFSSTVFQYISLNSLLCGRYCNIWMFMETDLNIIWKDCIFKLSLCLCIPLLSPLFLCHKILYLFMSKFFFLTLKLLKAFINLHTYSWFWGRKWFGRLKKHFVWVIICLNVWIGQFLSELLEFLWNETFINSNTTQSTQSSFLAFVACSTFTIRF